MTEPVTTFDTRYSEPDATATSWEQSRHALETAELAWLSTVRADGRPHATPVVPVWLDGAMHFTTGSDEQKAINLRTNPHVLLTTGCTWNDGLAVVIEGEAVRVTDTDQLNRLASAWTTKWDGRWQFHVGNGVFHDFDIDILVFSVVPSKAFAFANGPTYGHTRYQF
jgi:general stress protein 26